MWWIFYPIDSDCASSSTVGSGGRDAGRREFGRCRHHYYTRDTMLDPIQIMERPNTAGGSDEEENASLRRLVDSEMTAKAKDLNELKSKQRTKMPFASPTSCAAQRLHSISATLKSASRETGPRVVSGASNVFDGQNTSKDCDIDFTQPLTDSRLKVTRVFHNLSPAELYEHACRANDGHVVESGALAVLSGAKTGRSPKDKRIVHEETTSNDIWWGEGGNLSMDEKSFFINRERAADYLNTLEAVYIFDGYACWDPEHRKKIRIVAARPYHQLFMHNMLIRPSQQELDDFGTPDFTIYNAGQFPCNRFTSYMSSSTSVDINFKTKEMVILGTQYAGEMKKGVFSIMHYLMPKVGQLSLHSGCNVSAENGDVTLFFGLSGTGKTTLSTEAHRPLVGDDEHVWSDNGVANIEGGCYAKVIGLDAKKEPEIYKAIRFGTVLENVTFEDETRKVNFTDSSITENTRAAYPIEFIENARIPCVSTHPKNIIMLSHDAFGVLPPVSKLTIDQAMYYFISGYSAKVAGTEMGVTKPEATFSACFGGAFLVWHPTKYAGMLAEKVKRHGTNVWLINSGYSGGGFGVGVRIKLRHTRAIIDAIHSGELERATMITSPIFNLAIPSTCSGVPDDILMPERQWQNQEEYYRNLKELAKLFRENFKVYEDGGGFIAPAIALSISEAGPQLS